jgi:hypothetical protein
MLIFTHFGFWVALAIFVDWDEDKKRSSSSKLVFDLTDVKDLDELSLDNDDKVLLDNNDEVLLNKDDEVLLNNKDEVLSSNWTILGGCSCPVRSITSLSLQRLL